MQLYVRSSLSLMNSLSECIISLLFVDQVDGIINVSEFLESPLEEVISAANIPIRLCKVNK